MKRYSVGTLGTFESETGEWVPADVAAEMYEALKDVAEALHLFCQALIIPKIDTAEEKKAILLAYDAARAALAKAEGRSL